jgi:hypothetical protein
MGRFRHRALHVKMEDRFGIASADFRHRPPPRITGSGRGIPADSLTHEIDISMVIVRRPMVLEVPPKSSPIERNAVLGQ